MLHVVSCYRVVTLEGYSAIDAVVRWKQDGKQKDCVKHHLQLTFRYERRPINHPDGRGRRGQSNQDDSQEEDDDDVDGKTGPQFKTHVWYSIDVSKDHGENNRLLTIEVWAQDFSSSVLEPIPLEVEDEDGWEDMDDDDEEEEEEQDKNVSLEDAMDAENEKEDDNAGAAAGDASMAENSKTTTTRKDDADNNNNDKRDRYAAYLDPDTLQDLLDWSQLRVDEYTAFFLLMSFPFYEHEWDLVGFVLDQAFGGDDDDDDNVEVVYLEKEDKDRRGERKRRGDDNGNDESANSSGNEEDSDADTL